MSLSYWLSSASLNAACTRTSTPQLAYRASRFGSPGRACGEVIASSSRSKRSCALTDRADIPGRVNALDSLTRARSHSACTQRIARQLLSNWRDHVARFDDVAQAFDAVSARHDGGFQQTRQPVHLCADSRSRRHHRRSARCQCGRGSGPATRVRLRVRGRISSVAADIIARCPTLHQ